MRIKIFINLCVLIFLFTSCSSLESGKYIKLKSRQTADSLSKTYGTASWKILNANRGKTLKKGEWVFIPQNKGLSSYFKEGRIPSSLSHAATASLYESTDFDWPVPSSHRISSKFGKRWGKGHKGIDISAKAGTSIVSVADGEVVYSGRGLGGYGNLTVISHSNGFFSVYAHAKKNYTKKGDKVFRGQVIALVGRTGRATGNHLHFEIRRDSVAIDPLRLFAKID